jgi:hypothetical protein
MGPKENKKKSERTRKAGEDVNNLLKQSLCVILAVHPFLLQDDQQAAMDRPINALNALPQPPAVAI